MLLLLLLLLLLLMMMMMMMMMMMDDDDDDDFQQRLRGMTTNGPKRATTEALSAYITATNSHTRHIAETCDINKKYTGMMN